MEHDLIVISTYNEVGQRDDVIIGPIARALKTSAGRAKLAQSMANPIRTNLNYRALSRSIFQVDQLPDKGNGV